jgi:Protein of unknown function (DUF2469)
MSTEELEELDAAQELETREQYKSALQVYRYEVNLGDGHTTWLANNVEVEVQEAGHSAYFHVTLTEAWSWDPHRQIRTLARVIIHTFDTVTIEDWKQGA